MHVFLVYLTLDFRTPLSLAAPPMARHPTIFNLTAASSLAPAHKHRHVSFDTHQHAAVAILQDFTIY